MSAGSLHKIVVFKSNAATTLGAGKADNYSTAVTTRGSLKKLSGNRSLSFGEMFQSSQYELMVRYDSSLTLRVDMKVEIESKTYSINSWQKVGEIKFYYKLIITEQSV